MVVLANIARLESRDAFLCEEKGTLLRKAWTVFQDGGGSIPYDR